MSYIVFVRHARAEDREKFKSKHPKLSDLKRPLTKKGVGEFKKIVKSTKLPKLDMIISSPATRTQYTAEILAKMTGIKKTKIKYEKILQPGSSITAQLRWLVKQKKTIAIVGHNPEISMLVASYLNIPKMVINLSKGAIVVVAKKPIRLICYYSNSY